MYAYLTNQHVETMSPLYLVPAYRRSQKNRGTLAALSIVRAASTSVRFRLSTTPFCSGVRATDVGDESLLQQNKPTTFSNSLERNDFPKSKSVAQNNVSNDFSKPVTTQTLPPNKKSILKNTNVLALGMYKLHTESTQTRTSQLPQDSRKTNKRMSFSTRLIPTTSVSKPQLKSNPMEDRFMRNNSQGKKQDVEDHRRSVKFSKNKTSLEKEKLFIVDSWCSKHMTGNLKLLITFVDKFFGTVKFGNDQIAPILGYGDMVQGAVTIKQ
nr:integrase, catalytic region, zinc finger, CCHC-type, peptidase aspartic, catalytic [Tanacetum cinerariifolium]